MGTISIILRAYVVVPYRLPAYAPIDIAITIHGTGRVVISVPTVAGVPANDAVTPSIAILMPVVPNGMGVAAGDVANVFVFISISSRVRPFWCMPPLTAIPTTIVHHPIHHLVRARRVFVDPHSESSSFLSPACRARSS